ncbi:MAG: tRNA (adenosine(37)-N6)-threonylcarbamoyltransferase complex ATPase subunit type 1 TsaE [Gemmatimonadetes bacterium]|nr:tRNA (adenosine(37)-N6)-threonylcarbamoyltransferase complex ATPase subunit type 1 TsaE [Gemmatimonadota bacterium]
MILGPWDEAALTTWGRELGARVSGPAWIGLRGPLGAGKSVLARALAEGIGVRATMPSPTFNLLFRYAAPQGRSLVHMDLYRLAAPEELDELGWDELPDGDEMVLVEWPERAGARWPAEQATEIELALVPGAPEQRLVTLRGRALVGDA